MADMRKHYRRPIIEVLIAFAVLLPPFGIMNSFLFKIVYTSRIAEVAHYLFILIALLIARIIFNLVLLICERYRIEPITHTWLESIIASRFAMGSHMLTWFVMMLIFSRAILGFDLGNDRVWIFQILYYVAAR